MILYTSKKESMKKLDEHRNYDNLKFSKPPLHNTITLLIMTSTYEYRIHFTQSYLLNIEEEEEEDDDDYVEILFILMIEDEKIAGCHVNTNTYERNNSSTAPFFDSPNQLCT